MILQHCPWSCGYGGTTTIGLALWFMWEGGGPTAVSQMLGVLVHHLGACVEPVERRGS